ncbi:hypothetical protein [Gemmata sp.]|uniref:hypothetical protein n=1 Tax=Gemmata sp. TaxID=1914242 RepID=UPI003F708374
MLKIVRPVGLWVVGAALAGAAGCGPPPPEDPWHPVSGTLKVDGVPPEGATIRFHSLTDLNKVNRPSVAQVAADGTFAMSVQGTGEYAVTVFWPETVPTRPGEEKIEGGDRLKGRYDRVETPAAKVNVAAGDNKVPPINLKRK